MAEQKWEGKNSIKLASSTPDQIWSLLADFCNLHKYVATIDTCEHVQGTPSPPQAGCTRHGVGTGMWFHEKLLTFDPVQRCLSYEMTENNIGFKNYVATAKVLPCDDGCVFELSYTIDPIEGGKYEDLAPILAATAQGIAKGMEEATKA